MSGQVAVGRRLVSALLTMRRVVDQHLTDSAMCRAYRSRGAAAHSA